MSIELGIWGEIDMVVEGLLFGIMIAEQRLEIRHWLCLCAGGD